MKEILKIILFIFFASVSTGYAQIQEAVNSTKPAEQVSKMPAYEVVDKEADKPLQMSPRKKALTDQAPDLDIKTETYENGKVKRQIITNTKTGEVVLKKYFREGALQTHAVYVNGKLDGPYYEYYEHGQLALSINFVAGKEHGQYVRYYPTGFLKEKGEFYLGNGQGLFIYFYEDGQLSKEVAYKDGRAEGLARTYYPNGQIATENQYKLGQPFGLNRSYFDNGQLKDTVIYQNGLRNGEFTVFDRDGHIEMYGHFVDDVLAGTVVSFYKNGIMKTAIDYRGGKIHGYSREYYTNGLLKNLDTYNNGFISNQIKYDKDGKMLKDKVFVKGDFALPNLDEWHFRLAGLAFVCGILLPILIYRIFWKRLQKAAQAAPAVLRVLNQTEIKSSRKNKEFNLLHSESERMYRRMVETVSNGLFLADAKGVLSYVNFAFAQIMGFCSKTDMIGSNIKDFLKDENEEFWKILYEKNVVKDCILKAPVQEGKTLILSVSANLLWDERGTINGIEGVVTDITLKQKLEDEIHVEKRKMELIIGFYEKIDTVRDMQVLANFTVEEVSNILEAKRCSLMLEDPAAGCLTILGAQGIPEDVIAKTQVKIGEQICGQAALKGEPILVKNIEYDDKFSRGKLPYYLGRSFMIMPFRINDKLAGIINVADKITPMNPDEPFSDMDFKILRIMAKRISTAIENVTLFKELNLQTVTDPITQIYNYRLFSESLDQEIRRLKRNKTDLCVSMIDMDHFKSYNDAFGHVAGDDLLRTFGEMLKSNLRDTDIVCRYAGDEFCVVFPNTNIQGAYLAAEKVRKVIEEYPFKQQITLSIGIAQYQEGMSKKDLILKADEALYKAKKNGRNQVVLAEDISAPDEGGSVKNA
ncbi:MAG TPA: diguanylate cyclase [Candidatus Omnitrophota bacterium]|nr:diguanylate cyclase [Candidatus Omnitrophota bacterium]HQO58942.1 diguanylate cyclase [Candidatus Omnitrophota bacterium]